MNKTTVKYRIKKLNKLCQTASLANTQATLAEIDRLTWELALINGDVTDATVDQENYFKNSTRPRTEAI